MKIVVEKFEERQKKDIKKKRERRKGSRGISREKKNIRFRRAACGSQA